VRAILRHRTPGLPTEDVDVTARDAVTAYVALGANLGDAAQALRDAVSAIRLLPSTRVTKTSSFYKTAPLEAGPSGEQRAPGGDYTNAVVEVQTAFTAPELLSELQQIELAAGRERPYINAPRTLDLDVLIYGTGAIDSPQLTVPHPRMMQRAFVLVPLAEIAPALVSAAQLQAVAHQQIVKLEAL
jgi:2-amino-4-hydroxy-6-hydroxymethyldihydropteridine diphosphokinase